MTVFWFYLDEFADPVLVNLSATLVTYEDGYPGWFIGSEIDGNVETVFQLLPASRVIEKYPNGYHIDLDDADKAWLMMTAEFYEEP